MNLNDTQMVLGFFSGIGTPELLIFAGILLLLFGGAKLPALMRNMGRSVNEFKAGIKEKPQEQPPAIEDEESEVEVASKVE